MYKRFVMPAQAGIQAMNMTPFYKPKMPCGWQWMPACAGMTMGDYCVVREIPFFENFARVLAQNNQLKNDQITQITK